MLPPENAIICADSLLYLDDLPDACVDAVITDPPYFRIVKNEWDNQWPDLSAFCAWCRTVAEKLARVMRPNASLVWFADDKTVAYIQVTLDSVFSLVNNMVWDKVFLSSKPSLQTVRSFLPCTERMLFYEQKAAPGLPATGLETIHSRPDCFASIKAYLRAERDKLKAKTGLKGKAWLEYMRNLTGSTSFSHYFQDCQFEIPSREAYQKLQTTGFFARPYDSPEGEGLRDEYEGLSNEYEGLRTQYEGLRTQYEALRRPFFADADAKEILRYPSMRADMIHPTQKPVPLLKMLIERITRPGALILDPFAGSCSLAVAAHETRRRFLCIDRDLDMLKKASARVENETKQKHFNF